jgi:hypothetical protein
VGLLGEGVHPLEHGDEVGDVVVVAVVGATSGP